MRETFIVAARRQCADGDPLKMRYAALVDSPEKAIESVRRIVSADTELSCTGDKLSSMTTRALGLRPGQARLV